MTEAHCLAELATGLDEHENRILVEDADGTRYRIVRVRVDRIVRVVDGTMTHGPGLVIGVARL